MTSASTNKLAAVDPGKVYLVGAGPGDPALLTIRGAELLRQADVVLYDYLVNPITTLYAGPQTELICLGRHGHSRIWSQQEINRRLVQLSQQGKIVVRLKSGDPMIFARAAEEITYLADHQVPFEIVPGITAACAVGSYAGIPLTHRDAASAVAFVTGQERADKENSSIDFAALARFPGTIVIYMGVTTAAKWSKQLMQHGMSPETPVALVRRCSFPDQACQRTCLGEVAACLTPYAKFPPPVLAVIGAVAATASAISWFQQRPLFGQTVLVTRPRQRSQLLTRQLSELGAGVLQQPAIEISPVPSPSPVDAILRDLAVYDWLLFSSANGVEYFFQRLEHLGLDVRAVGSCQLAAVGPATVGALNDRGLHPDLVPPVFQSAALVDELLQRSTAPRCLVVCGSRTTGVIEQRLTDADVPGRLPRFIKVMTSSAPTTRRWKRWTAEPSIGPWSPARRLPIRWPPCWGRGWTRRSWSRSARAPRQQSAHWAVKWRWKLPRRPPNP